MTNRRRWTPAPLRQAGMPARGVVSVFEQPRDVHLRDAELRAARDNVALWEFLQHRVGMIEGVRQVETLSILKVHKLCYSTPAG